MGIVDNGYDCFTINPCIVQFKICRNYFISLRGHDHCCLELNFLGRRAPVLSLEHIYWFLEQPSIIYSCCVAVYGLSGRREFYRLVPHGTLHDGICSTYIAALAVLIGLYVLKSQSFETSR